MSSKYGNVHSSEELFSAARSLVTCPAYKRKTSASWPSRPWRHPRCLFSDQNLSYHYVHGGTISGKKGTGAHIAETETEREEEREADSFSAPFLLVVDPYALAVSSTRAAKQLQQQKEQSPGTHGVNFTVPPGNEHYFFEKRQQRNGRRCAASVAAVVGGCSGQNLQCGFFLESLGP